MSAQCVGGLNSKMCLVLDFLFDGEAAAIDRTHYCLDDVDQKYVVRTDTLVICLEYP